MTVLKSQPRKLMAEQVTYCGSHFSLHKTVLVHPKQYPVTHKCISCFPLYVFYLSQLVLKLITLLCLWTFLQNKL